VNVYFHTFGCKANQYDTALVRQAFADQGAVMVDDPAAADLAVVNSCTVTHESEAKLRRLVRRLARRGGRGRGRGRLETVVMGCAAARDEGAIAALPGVRAVVGGAEPVQVLRAAGLTSPPASPSGPLSTASPPGPLSTHVERGNAGQGSRARGLLKIQDGCDEHCTFCATTIARGANRSRSIPELVREAQALAEHHAEIVLTGIHIGTYGQDRGSGLGARDSERLYRSPSPQPRAPTLGSLLKALISRVPQVRFRLSSIEATEVDDTIARLLIEAPANLAAHLHAPLQSGANRILKRMGRHWYTAESYRARLEWLAERLPVFGLGADIIAGFPGESDAEHRQTVALVDALPFTYLHVFPYSERPGAAAARLGERVPAGTIRERARELRERGEANARAHRASRLGQRADGVVCGHGEGKVEVLTEDYLSVYLPTHEWNGRPRFEVTVR
jgi:threonylcarbamoyladenosine tRNA methylthiotransferase MtaB